MEIRRIDIGTAVKKLDDLIDEGTGRVKTYGIRFITSDGRIRTMEQARKNVKNPRQKLKNGNSQKRGRRIYNLKYHGVILLHDDYQNQFRSVKLANIFQFRDHKSNQWLDVFH